MMKAVCIIADEIDCVEVELPVAELAFFKQGGVLFHQANHAQDQLMFVNHDLSYIGLHLSSSSRHRRL